MLYRDIIKFAKIVKANYRIIGLDFGQKKIGIAFSDSTHLIATAHSVYKRCTILEDLDKISKIIVENNALAAVIGLPLNFYDGQENHWCDLVSKFAFELSKKMSEIFSEYPIYMQDERFSTIIASDILKSAGVNRKKARFLDDKIAAANILQQALDRMKLPL